MNIKCIFFGHKFDQTPELILTDNIQNAMDISQRKCIRKCCTFKEKSWSIPVVIGDNNSIKSSFNLNK